MGFMTLSEGSGKFTLTLNDRTGKPRGVSVDIGKGENGARSQP